MVALLGLAILLHVIHADLTVGLFLLLLGVAGLGWELRQVWHAEQARRARSVALAERARLVAARRERAQRLRQERRNRRETEERARVRQAEALRIAHEETVELRRREDLRRAERQERMERAAARWQALDGDALCAEIEALFVRRDLVPVRVAPEAPCDLLLAATAEERAVARCMPAQQMAHSADVQALDAWRREVGAPQSYLIALAGFSPAAVRLARSLPVTLVEAHLLATWEV